MDFVIRQWSAWADGLSVASDWQAWAGLPLPVAPVAGAAPALPHVPALARRRLNRLGRMVLQVLQQTRDGAPGATDLPVVLASRYGDTERALGELDALARGQTPSPAAFALSVHNALGATCSIIEGTRANMVAVAAAEHSAAAGVVEALGLLHDGAPEVLLVCYDEDLPPVYQCFVEVPVGAWAWAWRLALPGAADTGLPRLRLVRCVQTEPAAVLLPDGLQALRFLLRPDDAAWQQGGWRWDHAARSTNVEVRDAALA